MKWLVFLVEEQSMKAALDELVPRLFIELHGCYPLPGESPSLIGEIIYLNIYSIKRTGFAIILAYTLLLRSRLPCTSVAL